MNKLNHGQILWPLHKILTNFSYNLQKGNLKWKVWWDDYHILFKNTSVVSIKKKQKQKQKQTNKKTTTIETWNQWRAGRNDSYTSINKNLLNTFVTANFVNKIQWCFIYHHYSWHIIVIIRPYSFLV